MKDQKQTTKNNLSRPYVLDLDSSGWQREPTSASMIINGVIRADSNNSFSTSNEPGNISCYSLPNGYLPIGHISLNDDAIIIFSTDEADSEIGLVKDCNYTTLINSDCLGFSTAHPIKGTFRIRNGCERNIYFVDGVNDDKHIDIDNLSQYWSTAYQAWIDGGMIGPEPRSKWDCDSMSLASTISLPSITDITVNDSGGSMPIGTVRLAFRYKDRSDNPTPVFLISQPIVIYDDNINSDYYNITGGYDEASGIENFQISNKTITVQLSDLDQSYETVEILAVHYINGDGVTTTSFIVGEMFISDSATEYTYAGPDSGSISIDTAEIKIDPIVYPTSKEILQFDNRLLRANVCSHNVDWKEFQKKANEIMSTYVAEEADWRTVDNERNAKNPVCIRGLMADEIYALGIRWILKDGTMGPVLHIPGRVADADSRINITTGNSYSHIRNQVPILEDWDTQLLNVRTAIIDSETDVLEEDVRHLGVSDGDTIERWKVFNTAQPLVQGNELEGIMAYHQSNANYPYIEDCDGVPVYPHTDNGGSYTMHKIRHHKLPDSTLVNTFDGNNLRYFSINLDNIAPPSGYEDKVQGYQVMIADSERTVLAKGIYTYAVQAKYVSTLYDVYYQPMPFYQQTNTLNYRLLEEISPIDNSDKALDMGCFVSPDFRFSDEFPKGVYIKAEKEIRGVTTVIREVDSASGTGDTGNGWISEWDTTFTPTWANRRIDDSIALGFDRVYEGFKGSDWVIDNRSNQQEIIFTDIADPVEDYASVDTVAIASVNSTAANFYWYASIKNTRDVYANIISLRYKVANENMFTPTTTSASVKHGDTIVAPFVHRKTVAPNGVIDGLDAGVLFRERHLASATLMPCESRTNFALAHESNDAMILYKNATAEEYLEPIVADRNDDGNNEAYYEEDFTVYNPDMCVHSLLKPAFGSFEEECSSCSNCHPNMIVYSGAATLDNLDAYKVTLANNFTQTEGTSGEITGLFSAGRSLFIRTEQSLFQQTPSAASLKGNGVNVYLGTGEFFSLPAKEIIKTDIGYGGSQNRFDYITTPYGTFYTDRRQGKVYQMLGGQLKPISDQKLSRFFKENLPSELIRELKSQGINYTLADSISSTQGLGIQTVYDPFFERIIFHIKDYYPLFDWTIYDDQVTYDPDDYVFKTSDSKFYKVNQSLDLVELSFYDNDEFENRSITVSYDPKEQRWVSFHSYHPTWMYGDSQTFYSFNGLNNFKHSTNKFFTKYYSTKYPFLIEVSTYSPNTTTLETVSWHSKVELYSDDNNDFFTLNDITFDKILAYTDSQSTGEFDIDIKSRNSSYDIYSSDVLVEQTDNNWKASKFRDYVSFHSFPFFTSSFIHNEYKDKYNGAHGYYDKVPYLLNYNSSLSEYQLSLLRDKEHFVRLEFQPGTDYRISIDNINLKTKHSFR